MSHFLTPWQFQGNNTIVTQDRSLICTRRGEASNFCPVGTAAFIVRACNAHYQLLEACHKALRFVSWANNELPCGQDEALSTELKHAIALAEQEQA